MPRHLFPIPALLVAAAVLWGLRLAARDEGPVAEGPLAPTTEMRTKSAGPTLATNLRGPDGFEIALYADDDLVHDAYCLTIDMRGHVVVSGPGYVRVLIDRNADGRADEVIPFTNGPKTGAQGMCFDGSDLLAVGDGGLLRYRDANGDFRADGPPELLLTLKTGGEHHAHAIRKGPDGLWYLICGNDTGVTAANVTDPASPVTEPEAGALLRFAIDEVTGKPGPIAVVADGLRNAYDFDFTVTGDPVTYDSDDEREVSLPWYRPTRVFRLTPGSHAGWFSRGWKRPDAYPEMPEVLASLGRGSPTGVEVYRHTQFPSPYRAAVFACDWTFGRVVAIPLGADGRPGPPATFLSAAGSEGFAPTDLAVGHDGSLFVTAGGRGTTGRVYRVRHVGDPVDEGTGSQGEGASRSGRAGPASDDPAAALADADPNVRKAAMHVVRRSPESVQKEIGRRAEEIGPAAVVRFHLGRLRRNRDFDLAALEAAIPVIESEETPPNLRYDAVRLAQLALGDVGPVSGASDTFSGYSARADLSEWRTKIDPLAVRIIAAFPTGDGATDEELLRLLSMLRLENDGLIARVLERITLPSDPTDDLHHLFALSRLRGPRDDRATRRTADALVGLDGKLEARRLNRDTNWDERLNDLFAALAAADPALPTAVVRHPEFGRPGHIVFLNGVSGELRAEAAAAVLRKSESAEDYRWTPEAVELIGTSNDPAARNLLQDLYRVPAVRGAALSALSARPDERDRSKFVAGLDDSRVDVVERCVAALERLSPTGGADEVAAFAAALRRLDRDPREYVVRDQVAKLLRRVVDDDMGFVYGPAGYRPQPEAVRRWAEYARSLAPPTSSPIVGDEWQAVQKSLSGMTTGDPQRGRAIYDAKSCGRCHDGGAVGPDLAGVTGRFSREDLFLAIADPDRDVSPRYRGVMVQTTDGHVVTGLVVYESADGVTLKDGEKIWRVEAADIEVRRPMETSLMPRGLLKGLTTGDLADLEAYLRTVGR